MTLKCIGADSTFDIAMHPTLLVAVSPLDPEPDTLNPNPKGPKYRYGTKYGFSSSNFPYGLGKYSPYGYLGPFG